MFTFIYFILGVTFCFLGTCNVSLSEVQNSMKECLIILDKLKKTQQDLQNNVDKISSADWKQKTIEIGVFKDHFTKIMTKYENPQTMAVVKRIIATRRKKRCNQKKRKTFRRQQLESEIQNREKIHKSIDQWLQHQREDLEKQKMVCIYILYPNDNFPI